MGVLDRFEKGVERVVSGAFAKAFRSEVKPVEIASAIRRQMDDRAAAVTRERTVVPNEFGVDLSEEDLEQVRTWGEDALAEEMVTTATEHATKQRYTFVGPVTVTFSHDPELEKGRFVIRSATVRGAAAPATVATPSQRHPIIDIDGQRYLLTGPVTQEAHDEIGAHPGGICDCSVESLHEDREPDTPVGMRLGIEEDLGMSYPVGSGPPQVGGHQLVEVVGSLQHRRPPVVDVEE